MRLPKKKTCRVCKRPLTVAEARNDYKECDDCFAAGAKEDRKKQRESSDSSTTPP